MNQTNELTSELDWDHNWEDFQPFLIDESDKILGRNGAFLQTLDKRFHIPENASFLELGGACSAYLCSLAKFKKGKATVIDYSSVGLSKTNKLFELNDCEVDVHQGDIFSYNFHNRKFDFILHWGLIEHFKDPIDIFSLSAGLLKSSGAAIFTMPNMEALGSSLWKKYDKEDYDTHIFHSDEFIQQLAKESGFSVHSTFHWGPPIFFNAGYWLKGKSILRPIINLFVRSLSLINKLIPIFKMGHRKISAHRAFVLVKV